MIGTSIRPPAKARREIRYQFLPWQVDPWRDQNPVLLLTGSAGGGKSRLAAEKLHGFCIKYPGAMALAVRKTRQSMVNSTVLVLERQVIAGMPGVTHNQNKNRFEYWNGSILAYGGMKDDDQREQIRSIGQDGGVDIAWMEEANRFTENDFNELTGRMRGKAADWRQLILTTNPDSPAHWIYRRLILKREAAVYKSAAADNPHNPADYQATLSRMTGLMARRLVRGEWVQAEGAIWPEFDPTIHVVPRFEIPGDWRRLRSVDFGYTNPFVCQWWAVDDDGRMYRYREIYRTQRLVEDHVLGVRDEAGNVLTPGIIKLSAGERIGVTVADHDAEDRATMNRHGVPTMPAWKGVKPGIEAVAARLRVAGDGKPRIFFLEDSLAERDPSLPEGAPCCTEEEIPGYVWPEGQDGKPNKEEPVKFNDHGCDDARYAVARIDNIGNRIVPLTGGRTVAAK